MISQICTKWWNTILYLIYDIHLYVQNYVYNAIENRSVSASWKQFCITVYARKQKNYKKDLIFSHPPQEFFKCIYHCAYFISSFDKTDFELLCGSFSCFEL